MKIVIGIHIAATDFVYVYMCVYTFFPLASQEGINSFFGVGKLGLFIFILYIYFFSGGTGD